jgi:hypothetical protein
MARIGPVLFSACLFGALAALPTTAGAQQAMGNQPWNFTAQNRAGIAALIQQQNGDSNTGGAAALACGGGGTATATANYTCIILNNSTGSIGANQGSDGDQTATSDTESSVNGVPEEDLSEVLETLTN